MLRRSGYDNGGVGRVFGVAGGEGGNALSEAIGPVWARAAAAGTGGCPPLMGDLAEEARGGGGGSWMAGERRREGKKETAARRVRPSGAWWPCSYWDSRVSFEIKRGFERG